LRKPTSAELSDQFDKVRTWIADLRQGTHYRVTLRELRHHIIGSNVIPEEIWIDTLENALALIGKGRDAGLFNRLVVLTRERLPSLLPWLSRRPLKALELAADWPLVLDIIGWMQAHPRPGIYLRQIELQGIHTKFLETHRAVLMELLDLALPPEAVDSEVSGIS